MNIDEKKTKEARDFAVQAHGEQKYGRYDYVVHLDHVADILKPYGTKHMQVGYLHDTLEHTIATVDHLKEAFGADISTAVEILTDPPGFKNRIEKKAHVYAKLSFLNESASVNAMALRAKVGDRLANIRFASAEFNYDSGKLKMYRREHPFFRQAAYRKGLCEPLWYEMDMLLACD